MVCDTTIMKAPRLIPRRLFVFRESARLHFGVAEPE
jgi:hypothetical protein